WDRARQEAAGRRARPAARWSGAGSPASAAPGSQPPQEQAGQTAGPLPTLIGSSLSRAYAAPGRPIGPGTTPLVARGPLAFWRARQGPSWPRPGGAPVARERRPDARQPAAGLEGPRHGAGAGLQPAQCPPGPTEGPR